MFVYEILNIIKKYSLKIYRNKNINKKFLMSEESNSSGSSADEATKLDELKEEEANKKKEYYEASRDRHIH